MNGHAVYKYFLKVISHELAAFFCVDPRPPVYPVGEYSEEGLGLLREESWSGEEVYSVRSRDRGIPFFGENGF